ncbi:amino acid adenylation domain-containing protein [Chromobacterium piscinae]|uniref:amino acid adenylation domain-containing protein n=1 Tax=Chromobacterium piscinae TaxID=686831 RepID=UPI001E2ACA8E|nr:amino acid adenylation domain-containing protein [Chromobacterium piscinae]
MLSIETKSSAVERELPLFGSQLGIWLADQIVEQKNTYTVAHCVELDGAIDAERLRQSIRLGLAEADTVVAQYLETPDGAAQLLRQGLSAENLPLPEIHDLSAEADPESLARLWMREDLSADLPADGERPLYLHRLFKLAGGAGERWFWYQRYHHVCVDGYSFAALTRRISDLYQALGRGEAPSPSPFVSFADVAAERDAYLASPRCEEDRAFWRDYAAALPSPSTLSARDALAGDGAANVDVLRRRFEIAGGTAAPQAMAAVFAYLARMGGKSRVAIGMPFMRRMGSAALRAVGPVVNVLPVALDVSDGDELATLARRLADELKRVRRHERYDAEQIQRDSGMVGSRRALYGATLNLKIYDQSLRLGEVAGVTLPLAVGPIDDIEFGLWQQGEALVVELSANPARYDAAELEWHAWRLRGFIAALAGGATVDEAPLHSAAERMALDEWSQGPRISAPAGVRTALDVFLQSAAQYENETALACGSERLSYGELSARVAQLARELLSRGIGDGSVVGVAVPRSVDTVVAILGTLAAGAAFLPLDLDYPPERLAMMCEDAGPALLLTRSDVRDRLPELPALCLDDGEIRARLAVRADQPLDDAERLRPLDGDRLAYMIYTSGSTGKPKGVMIAHASFLNLLLSQQTGLFGDFVRSRGRRVRTMQTASLSFDGALEQLFWLFMGQEVHLCDEELRRDAQQLVELARRERIDEMDVPPSLLRQMLDCGLMDDGHWQPGMVMVGGEAVPPALWKEMRGYSQLHFHNFYGPTEYTISALGAPGTIAEEPVVGRPVANTRALVLDAALRPVAIGVAGELYLAGAGLGLGYLNRPSLTAARFVASPFGDGELMYRTGDLVRWNARGQMDFIGRVDHQVKVRGFRIEMGEVEHALASLPGVNAAVVLAEAVGGSHRLIAYCTMADDGRHEEAGLSAALLAQVAETLPDYMVPSALAVLPEWPVNINGKIDRKALPAIRPQNAAAGREPANDAERLLCAAVARVLNLEQTSPDDDFFLLGGDSISAMSLGTELRRAGFLLRPRDVFAKRTPAGMAAALQPLSAANPAADDAAGPLGKLPIVSWFAEQCGMASRFVQGVWLKAPAALSAEHLAAGLLALQRAHPALRSRAIDGQLHIDAAPAALDARILIDAAPDATPDQLFETACARLDPENGLMLQAALRSGADGKHVMLAVHHLAVDGVSWRALLPELQSACEAAMAGEAVQLPREEFGLREWAKTLAAQVPARRGELAMWRGMLAGKADALSAKALDPARDRHDTARHSRALLGEATSAALLQKLPNACRATVEEILLAALLLACRGEFDAPRLRVGLESHGRYASDDGIHLGRTVGWLTAEYPARFDLSARATGDASALEALRAVKRVMRAMPDHGLGYGVLRYLDDEHGPALGALETQNRPALLFNYLGRFQAGDGEWTPLAAGGRFADAFAVDIDPALPLQYGLEANVFVDESGAAPRVAVNWTWADALYGADAIERLGLRMDSAIAALAHLAERDPLAAADTLVAAETLGSGGAPLSDAELAALCARHGSLAAALPVLPLQQGLLFHAQLGEAAGKYNSITRVTFEGPLGSDRLRAALAAVLRRHPQLAAGFDSEAQAEPLQLLPLVLPEWPWRELELAASADEAEALQALEHEELNRDFTVGGPGDGPLLQATLARHGQLSTLFLTAHHLVVDGWSTPIMLRDLLAAYGDGPDTLSSIRVDYPSVVRALSARDLTPARQLWLQTLDGVKPTLLFGQQMAAPEVRELELVVPKALEDALTERCRERGLTLNTTMQGMWGALLSVLTGRNDVVFGSPVSGRFSPVDGVDEHIGLFSNTIPVRVALRPDATLWDQLADLQARQIRLLEHDGLGLAEIQRLAGAATLFDTLLVVENYPDQDMQSRDYHCARIASLRNRGHTHYPLTVLALPGDRLRLLIEYRDLVKQPQQLAERMLALLEHLAYQPELPWSAFNPLTGSERELIERVNATATATVIPETTLPSLLAEQAARTPDAPALLDEARALSYAETRAQVAHLAGRLAEAGVKPGDIVAVALPRSAHLSLALMAAQEAGAAYLPLDTGYPDERLAYMVADAKPALIVTCAELAPRFASMGTLLLQDELAIDPQAFDAPALTPDHAAYLLYTSGSTGRPKGVLVSHRAIVNRLLWMQHEYGLGADDVVLQKTPCSFDVSVWEFFWPLIVGAKLFMAPPDAHRDPEALLELIAARGVTTLHFVPSMLAALLAHMRGDAAARSAQAAGLRRVFCSGEGLSRELADGYAGLIDAPLHNLYGPTEAAVDVSYQPAAKPAPESASVPIGLPVWNTALRILDAALRPVPVGAPGELYLCGVQLAHGYLGRPDLTASRFVADPYADGERMYRTGDIARWLPDGAVEYLGRSDDQLKIRGQRVELGEIEAALLAQPGVARAVVHARALGGQAAHAAGADNRQLVGYVIAADQDNPPEADALRAALAKVLPAHMVPVAVMRLADFPLSANGKLDRKALPEPSAAASIDGREPRPGLESRIAALFAEILERDAVRADDDFFALGGHSLLAMRLAATLRRELKLPVSVGQIMSSPTVAKLAAVLSDAGLASDPALAGFGEVLPLRAGKGRPLFCIHPASGFAWQYSGLSRHLRQGLALVGLQSPRPDGAIARCADMDEVCDRHLANLRRIQPQGPYHLIGYSLGGTVAQALAAKLRQQGEEVAFLGLLDTYPPEGQDWNGPTEEEAKAEVAREQEQFMSATEDAADAFMLREKTEMFGHIVANYQDAVRLLSQARTPRYDGEATLFVARRTLPDGMDVRETWRPHLAGLSVHELDCAHEDIVSPQSLETLGPLLDGILEEVSSLG